MESFSLAWAAKALGARLVLPARREAAGAEDAFVLSVCTDTRRAEQGSLFFALQGENADGHEYAPQAFAAGAIGAVVSRELPEAGGPLLIVPDTLQALGDLAKQYRRQFSLPVIGVTGSVGKTSTKEMIAAILRMKCRTLASEKNYNNEIGVPLALFQLTREHEAAVIEMGMRGPGQIDRLAEIAEPTMAVITNIGFAHLELLGSQQNIAAAKSELLARLPAGAVAILPWRDPFFDYLQSRVPEGCSVITYGVEAAGGAEPDARVIPLPDCESGIFAAKVAARGQEASLNLKALGAHHLHNAGAAFAVACALDIPIPAAARALEQWEGAEGRMVARKTPSGLTVLDDCYNAGVESMEAALHTLQFATAAGRVAILGDMKELGDFSEEAHRRVGRKVADTEARLLVTVGEMARTIAEEAERYARERGRSLPETVHFPDSETAAREVPALLAPQDTVLVKGSRAMEMEQIVAALTGGEAGAHG